MASTTPPHPCVPSLLDMPPEILQDIFWRSLELSLCHVSRRMYQTLPSYPRLARFLPVLAFGSDLVLDKIIHNDGDDCSDVVKKLSIATPLSDKDRVTLQLTIMDSGWFDFSNFVEISHTLEEYLIQQFWVEKGIKTEPDDVEEYEKRNANLSDALRVRGRTQDGQLCQLSVQSVEVSVLYYDESEMMGTELLFEEDYRMLHIRCIPNRILKAPLAPADNDLPLWPYILDDRRLFHTNIIGPVGNFWRLIWGMGRFRADDPDYMKRVVVSPQAVELAISEAVSISNHYVLGGILRLPLTADGEGTLQPVTAEHFIAAARRSDRNAIRVMWKQGYSVFPFNNGEVIDWMHDPDIECADSTCRTMDFVDQLRRFKRELDEQREPNHWFRWPYLGVCSCCEEHRRLRRGYAINDKVAAHIVRSR
ncbi:hypothetical protein EPUS_00814 [Endocarpon pusillum Z07020]|uniref:Uncharacterized protein n=1 Tax=Endocarpon pusillum (strain Z07020 / HMAS-L-300199) TaxID=1263415 RepID=U1HYU6_ENDPU|nr:uncharacterized protein EPUS_00814 [Endocarpon pusillum Z07020]ERF74684.1 hypothetical protein EPUS_00814 [Endocarpon pusillum Z07020]